MLDKLDPGAARGHCQCAAELAVFDLVVARAPHRGGDAGLQMRLLLARLGRGEPGEVKAEPLLEFEGMAQLRRVIAVERDDDRPLVAVFGRDAGCGLDLAREIRPQALAFERERQQRLFARLGLDRRGKHAGRRPTRAMPGFAPVVDAHRAARLREPPGDAEADDAGADDDRLRSDAVGQQRAR